MRTQLNQEVETDYRWWHKLVWRPTDALAALLLPIVIPVVFYVSADFWQVIGILPSWAEFILSQTPLALIAQYAISLLVEVGVIVWLSRLRRASFVDFGFKPAKTRWYFVAIVLYMVQILLIVGIFMLINKLIPAINTEEEQSVLEFGKSGWGFWLSFVSSVVVAPVIEEIVFRGIILIGLAKKFPLWVAAIISALAFALLHGQINVGIYTFIFGIILSYTYIRSGSIYPGIMAHFINNLIAFWLIS